MDFWANHGFAPTPPSPQGGGLMDLGQLLTAPTTMPNPTGWPIPVPPRQQPMAVPPIQEPTIGPPMDITPNLATGGSDYQGNPQNANAQQRPSLQEALRGVRAPTAPETQRLGLPGYAPAPRAPTPVKGGDLMAMLQLMAAGSGATAKNSYDLPSTLGAALRGR